MLHFKPHELNFLHSSQESADMKSNVLHRDAAATWVLLKRWNTPSVRANLCLSVWASIIFNTGLFAYNSLLPVPAPARTDFLSLHLYQVCIQNDISNSEHIRNRSSNTFFRLWLSIIKLLDGVTLRSTVSLHLQSKERRRDGGLSPPAVLMFTGMKQKKRSDPFSVSLFSSIKISLSSRFSHSLPGFISHTSYQLPPPPPPRLPSSLLWSPQWISLL